MTVLCKKTSILKDQNFQSQLPFTATGWDYLHENRSVEHLPLKAIEKAAKESTSTLKNFPQENWDTFWKEVTNFFIDRMVEKSQGKGV